MCLSPSPGCERLPAIHWQPRSPNQEFAKIPLAGPCSEILAETRDDRQSPTPGTTAHGDRIISTAARPHEAHGSGRRQIAESNGKPDSSARKYRETDLVKPTSAGDTSFTSRQSVGFKKTYGSTPNGILRKKTLTETSPAARR
jgi:hypothetical protein